MAGMEDKTEKILEEIFKNNLALEKKQSISQIFGKIQRKKLKIVLIFHESFFKPNDNVSIIISENIKLFDNFQIEKIILIENGKSLLPNVKIGEKFTENIITDIQKLNNVEYNSYLIEGEGNLKIHKILNENEDENEDESIKDKDKEIYFIFADIYPCYLRVYPNDAYYYNFFYKDRFVNDNGNIPLNEYKKLIKFENPYLPKNNFKLSRAEDDPNDLNNFVFNFVDEIKTTSEKIKYYGKKTFTEPYKENVLLDNLFFNDDMKSITYFFTDIKSFEDVTIIFNVFIKNGIKYCIEKDGKCSLNEISINDISNTFFSENQEIFLKNNGYELEENNLNLYVKKNIDEFFTQTYDSFYLSEGNDKSFKVPHNLLLYFGGGEDKLKSFLNILREFFLKEFNEKLGVNIENIIPDISVTNVSGFTTIPDVTFPGGNPTKEKLSNFFNSIIAFWRDKLEEKNDKFVGNDLITLYELIKNTKDSKNTDYTMNNFLKNFYVKTLINLIYNLYEKNQQDIFREYFMKNSPDFFNNEEEIITEYKKALNIITNCYTAKKEISYIYPYLICPINLHEITKSGKCKEVFVYNQNLTPPSYLAKHFLNNREMLYINSILNTSSSYDDYKKLFSKNAAIFPKSE